MTQDANVRAIVDSVVTLLVTTDLPRDVVSEMRISLNSRISDLVRQRQEAAEEAGDRKAIADTVLGLREAVEVLKRGTRDQAGAAGVLSVIADAMEREDRTKKYMGALDAYTRQHVAEALREAANVRVESTNEHGAKEIAPLPGWAKQAILALIPPTEGSDSIHSFSGKIEFTEMRHGVQPDRAALQAEFNENSSILAGMCETRRKIARGDWDRIVQLAKRVLELARLLGMEVEG